MGSNVYSLGSRGQGPRAYGSAQGLRPRASGLAEKYRLVNCVTDAGRNADTQTRVKTNRHRHTGRGIQHGRRRKKSAELAGRGGIQQWATLS
eukprot:2377945-Rhodomonas_salina.1